jgi:hypothetical protein
MVEKRNAYRILVGKTETKKPLGRLRHKWEDNIKINFEEIRWDYVDWIHLTLDRYKWQAVVKMAMNLWVPLNVGEFLD